MNDKINTASTFFIIKSIFNKISRKVRIKLIFIILISIIATFSELIGIGMIIPFIGSFTNEEIELIKNFKSFFGITNDLLFFQFITIGLIISIILSISIRFFSIYYSINVSNLIGLQLGTDVLRNTLSKNYIFHINNRSSDVVSILTNKIGSMTNAIFSVFLMISSTIISLGIIVSLFFLFSYQIIFVLIFICIIYFIITKYTKNILIKNSFIEARSHSMMVESIQESLGSIRNLIIDQNNEKYLVNYYQYYKDFLFKNGNSRLIQQSPKFVLEGLGMIIIASLAIYGVKNNTNNLLIILGTLVFASQRLVPLIQQAYSCYSSILASKQAILEGLDILDDKEILKKINNKNVYQETSVSFKDNIEFNNVSFKYNNSKDYVLSNLNFKIKKGEMIGIVGNSGVGKSTFLDLLMGLIEPTEGEIKIDGNPINYKNVQSFHKIISHVPQSIFLLNRSILDNIGLTESKNTINKDKVIKSSKVSKIYDFVQNLKFKFDHHVGERGGLLSGGQRQRLAIARALYKDSELLILDEATNSVDNVTEKEIYDELIINFKNLTTVIVSHNEDSIKFCDKIYELKNKTLLLKNK